FGDRGALVYCKMGRLLLVSSIQAPGMEQWKGSRIARDSGIVGSDEYVLPEWLLNFMAERARHVHERVHLSVRQSALIGDTVRKNPDRVVDSETFRAL